MYCPKCKTEYRAGLTTCTNCGLKLVPMPKESSKELVYADWQYLITAANETEANVMSSILEGEGILVNAKPEGAGGYLQVYMGQTRFGVKIYVPKDCLDKAKEVIATYNYAAPQEHDNKEEEEEDAPSKSRYILAWIIAIPFLLGVLGAFIFTIINYFMQMQNW